MLENQGNFYVGLTGSALHLGINDLNASRIPFWPARKGRVKIVPLWGCIGRDATPYPKNRRDNLPSLR